MTVITHSLKLPGLIWWPKFNGGSIEVYRLAQLGKELFSRDLISGCHSLSVHNTAAKRWRIRDLPHFRFASLAKMSPHESRNIARDKFPGLSLALVRRALSRGTGEWLPFENRYLVGLRSF